MNNVVVYEDLLLKRDDLVKLLNGDVVYMFGVRIRLMKDLVGRFKLVDYDGKG